MPQAESLIRLPVVKDRTDLQAAADHARALGYRMFRIYGALGGSRLSHTIANLKMLCSLVDAGCDARLIDANCVVCALREGTLRLPAREHGFVSVFAANDRCEGVTIRGLKYEITGETLDQRFPLGVSNECIGKPAEISVARGTLLLLFEPPVLDIC